MAQHMSGHRLDARSPLVLDTHELTRQAGTFKAVELTAPAPAGMGIDLIGVPEGSPMHLQLTLESVVEGILVTGTVAVELAGECARCLEPVTDAGEYEIQELYLYPGKEVDDDEAPRIVDDLIDLEPAVRDAVVLELPFTPLCRENCEGLCPVCGANLNADPDHRHDAAADPRWEKLAQLPQADAASQD